MSRTNELRRGGAQERGGGGGGGAPFVAWHDCYAWVEGEVVNVWSGKYGDTATMAVTAVSDGLEAKGKTEDGQPLQRPVTAGTEVNVGLNYATLKETIRAEDKGRRFHVAFEGWGESKNGDRYRIFAVLELSGNGEGVEQEPVAVGYSDAPPPGDDDFLPF